MVEIGGYPILWHILKHYSHYHFDEFFIALGYKGDVIKRYFLDYCNLQGNVAIDLSTGAVAREASREDWRVNLIETGIATHTGGRIVRLQSLIGDETFMVTYGDGVSDVNLEELVAFHRASGRIATVTAVRPPARYGGLLFDGNLVREFTEKPQAGEGWINGGYLVLEPAVFDYLDGDESSLEIAALSRLAANRELAAYRHHGFWQCMDTVRDRDLLQHSWQTGTAPWKIW